MDLMWFLFLAHLIGDYALQTDHMAENKGRDVGALTLHVSIYVICIAVTLWLYAVATSYFDFYTSTIAGLIAILFALHWTQDYIKSRHFPRSKQAYYIDQVLHLMQLYAIRLLLR